MAFVGEHVAAPVGLERIGARGQFEFMHHLAMVGHLEDLSDVGVFGHVTLTVAIVICNASS